MALTIEGVFTGMPGRFNPEAAGDWAGKLQFNIGEENWFVDVADGKISTGKGTVENPDTTVITNAETWLGLLNGTVDGMSAMTSGNLQISGDLGQLFKLQDRDIFSR